MSGNSSIEWTDKTWNPVTGCDRVSPGCDHCYAETIANRFAGSKAFPDGFKVTLHPDRLEDPLHWRKPARVFVNSMSDLFHPDISDGFIGSVWDIMAKCPRHTFQVLTKRPQRMAKLLHQWDVARWLWRRDDMLWCGYGDKRGPFLNIWCGTSIENDRYVFRATHLRATPAKVRFLSLEPLLGPLPSLDLTDIDWVIVGGESGPGARPMRLPWVRDIRDRCIEANIPFFFKQWGEFVPTVRNQGCPERYRDAAWAVGDEFWPVWRVGKKTAGRLLDGFTWSQYPEVVASPLSHLSGRLEGGL